MAWFLSERGFDLVHFFDLQGADIDVRDDECQTPLLLATSKSGWKTVKFLLGKGVQIDITDNKNRNFLHLAIMNNCDLGEFGNFELMNKVCSSFDIRVVY